MINQNLILETKIEIAASQADVWDALINPEKIEKYFFGTHATSDWKKGSELTFSGVWEGTRYVDKGTILDTEPEVLLSYNYISSFSKLDDIPENRSIITFTLEKSIGGTLLTLVQKGFESEETLMHSTKNWEAVLANLKQVVEA